MESINENILLLRKKHRLSQAQLGAKVGVSSQAISQYETGASTPKLDVLVKLGEVFKYDFLNNKSLALPESESNKNVTEPDLAKDLTVQEPEEEYKTSNPRLEARPTRLYPDPLDHDDKSNRIVRLADGTLGMRVPIVPQRAYAGYMRGYADPQYYDDLEDILIGVDREPHGVYIGFEVVGDSMICIDTLELAEESIFPGRIAIGRDLPRENWKTKLHTHNYKNWIFVHKTEGILIKQIANHDIEKGTITVHSLNPKYQDETFKLDDMQQIFSVIQIDQKTRPKPKH